MEQLPRPQSSQSVLKFNMTTTGLQINLNSIKIGEAIHVINDNSVTSVISVSIKSIRYGIDPKLFPEQCSLTFHY